MLVICDTNLLPNVCKCTFGNDFSTYHSICFVFLVDAVAFVVVIIIVAVVVFVFVVVVIITSKVGEEQARLMSLIRDLRASKLSRNIICPDREYSWFSSVPKAGLRNDCFFIIIFSIHY
jgi:hypothetical protein